MLHKYNEGIAAIQIDRDRVALHTQYGDATLAITTLPDMIGLAVDAEHLVVLSERDEVQVFHINKGGIALRSQFVQKDAVAVALYRDSVFVAAEQGRQLQVMELDGNHRLSLPFSDGINHLCVNSDFLAVATSQKTIHLLDVTTGEPQEVKSPVRLDDADGTIVRIACSADGTWVSVQVGSSSAIHLCNFSDGGPSTSTASSERIVTAALPSDLSASAVRSLCWDIAESNVMACEYDGGAALLFVTEQGDIIEAARVKKKDLGGKLLGIDVPRVYAAQIEYGGPSSNEKDTKTCDIVLSASIMSSFRGMEDEGPSTLSALVQFAYFTALCDLESAYIAIQLVKRPEIWEKLCLLGIRQQNLDLVQRCLPNLGNEMVIQAAKRATLRISRGRGQGGRGQNEEIATLTAIALELGATDEAETLLRSCARYDLLVDLLRSQNRWDEALASAQDHGDASLLEETHYQYAEYLENTVGEEGLAAEHYMLSGRVKEFLVRLVEDGRLKEAEDIVVKAKEPELMAWLAQRYEESNHVDAATELYQLAGDDLGLARQALCRNDIDAATSIAESGDAAVVHHVAKHLEDAGEAQQAMALFIRGGMLDDAMRLATRHGFHSEIAEVVLNSGDSERIVDCAVWLEGCGQLAEAALLYAENGNRSKVLDLCLRMDDGGISGVGQELKELFSSIVDDIDDVTTLTDAEVSTYARRFITWDEGERAFDFLCRSRNQYATFFASFGSLCNDRGDHRLASKLFAKAGDKISSLTSLINTQDTKTIVAFAKAAKSGQAYEMAAAYLQSLPDWTQEEQHISSIFFFLGKVGNYSDLAQVHEALARACIDESEHYEKSLDLLTQGASYVEKIDDVHQRATLRRRFQRQLYSVTKFLRAKKSLKQSTEPMEVFCAEAASREDGSTGNIVRVEHGIKDLVLQYVSVHRYRDAFDLIHAMDYPSTYIPRNIMEQVWTACNRDPREIAAIIAEDENRDDCIFAPDDGKLGGGIITDEERTVLSGMGLNF